MFAAKASLTSDNPADAPPASQYVLFEQSPLTDGRILQGAATRAVFAAWERQERLRGLPLLSGFETSGVQDMLPSMVIHQVHRGEPYGFEMVYAGADCARSMNMSRERRVLKPDPESANTSDVYARLLDVSVNRSAHFCVKSLGWQGQGLTKYEALLLPFGEEGFEGPVAIVSVLSFSSRFDSKVWFG